MYQVPRNSGSIYSAEEPNEANDPDCDTQHLLENVAQGQRAPCTCKDNHHLFIHKRKNSQFPCPPKKSIIRLIFNLIVLSLIIPFCIVKKLYSTLSSESCVQNILFWITLFLLFLGAAHMGLFNGGRLQLFGGKWEDFSICDLIQGETKDLKSLIKANHVLERKALEIPPLKDQVKKLQSQLHDLRSDMRDITLQSVRGVLERYTSKGITTWSVEKMLKKLIEKLDEDYVRMPDYALKSAAYTQQTTGLSHHSTNASSFQQASEGHGKHKEQVPGDFPTKLLDA